jgi:hypothetical protein
MNLPPYAMPVALAVGCLGLLLVALVAVKRNGWTLMSGRQAAQLAVSWGQAAALLWTMEYSGDWSPRPEATAILVGLLTVNFGLLLAGGEDPDPQALAAAEARGRAAATTDARVKVAHEIAQHIEAKDHDVPLSELAAQIRRYGGRRPA